MADDGGSVYLIHFAQPIGDLANPKGHAQHYIGYTEDLARRAAEERGPAAPAILRAVNEAGIGWRVVRTWEGTRDTERQIKLLRAGTRLCPECTEHPLSGAGAVARAAALRRHREAQLARQREREAQQARALAEYRVAAQARLANPYADGQRMARQWLARQDEAARTADQIEAAHDYVTGPWREMTHHSPAEIERHRGYVETVQAALTEFRADEAELATSEQEADVDEDRDTWLARDGGQVVEVDAATGYPGREASPDDGRPVAEADEVARDYDAHADRYGRLEDLAMEDAYRDAHPQLAELEAEAG